MSIFPRASQKNSRRKPMSPLRLTNEVVGIILITLGILMFLSLWSYSEADFRLFSGGLSGGKEGSSGSVQNLVGVVGATLAFGLFWVVGWAAYTVPLLITLQGVRAFGEEGWEAKVRSVVGSLMGVAFISALVHLQSGPESSMAGTSGVLALSGGVAGKWVGMVLGEYFAHTGSLILLSTGLVVAILLIRPFSLADTAERASGWMPGLGTLAGMFAMFRFLRGARSRKPKANKPVKINRSLTMRNGPYSFSQENDEEEVVLSNMDDQEESEEPADQDPLPKTPSLEFHRQVSAGYRPPDPVELLDSPPVSNKHQTDQVLEGQSRVLTGALQNFGIGGKVTEIHPGPVITMYEFEPGPGIKVARIVTLAHDLAMALKATNVRIVAPLPGKSTVGIEVPNPVREMVALQEILTNDAFIRSRSKLALALGKDIFGRPLVADLKTMPHLLVAGATGAGKSVALNSMLLSMLFSAHPDEVKLLLIDPKVLELQVYDGIPHLLRPVITDPKAAARGLTWVVQEMERRYRLLAEHGVRNIHAFNLKMVKSRDASSEKESFGEEEQSGGQRPYPSQEDLFAQGESTEDGDNPSTPPGPLPYIVVVIDEFADLMMVAPKEVEEKIARLAQMARASGIHLILATQRPSVDVVTGLIKANFPARIAFQVSSKIDSRTILDANGAEALLGLGDMLYMAPGSGRITRLHGSYVSDEDVRQVVEWVKAQAGPSYSEEIRRTELPMEEEEQERDEVYEQAKEVVMASGQASASLIQRRLRVGYPRAARMIEQMEEDGLVSAAGRDGRREVLARRMAMKEGV